VDPAEGCANVWRDAMIEFSFGCFRRHACSPLLRAGERCACKQRANRRRDVNASANCAGAPSKARARRHDHDSKNDETGPEWS